MNRLLQLILPVFSALWITSCAIHSGNESIAMAKTHGELAMAYLKQHNLAVARQMLATARQEAPRYPVVWYASAYYYEQQGNQQAADRDYRWAIQLAPDSGGAHNNYGVYLCRCRQFRRAEQEFLLAEHKTTYLKKILAYKNAGLCKIKANKLVTQ